MTAPIRATRNSSFEADVIIVDTADDLGRLGADIIKNGIDSGAIRTLGVATGSSPLPIYRALSAHSPLPAHLNAFALDEYIGIPSNHPESYRQVIRREITEPLGLSPARVYVPDGQSKDLEEEARRYEHAIAAVGGIDLQILGIGTNGHIGFNEPGSAFDSRTRQLQLDEDTRRANARFFNSLEEVPRRCMTQGIGTILEARQLLLIATGGEKAEAVAAALEGPVHEKCPASALQRHPSITVLLDRAAAAGLEDRS